MTTLSYPSRSSKPGRPSSEQRHLDESQHALYRQPNYTRMGEDAATEEDPSRREERQTESW